MMSDTVILQSLLPLVAAGTGEEWYIANPGPYKLKVEKMYVVPLTNRTADATNYTTLTASIGGNTIGAEATTVADLGNLTAGTPFEIAITGSGKNLEIAVGSAIKLAKSESGTGLAFDGHFAVLCSAVRI